MAQRSVLVVDGNSWMHRAFHAISQPLTAPDGRPTNAVFGFFLILTKAIAELKPDAVVIAFDAGKPAFRMEALGQYKVHRPPTDPTLKAQFPIVEGLLASMDVPVIKVDTWEGDDILGTLATQGEACGLRVYLATGDRDAYQLITENVSVVSSKVGAGELVIVRPSDVLDRYGISVEQVVDYLGLKGDPSDNIPGVPGIGEKTASRLLQEYGTLEAVIDAAKAGFIKGRAGANLVEFEGAARASRTVATIMRDVPFELDLAAVEFGHFDTAKVSEAFGEFRLRAPLAKILELGRQSGAEEVSASIQTGSTDLPRATKPDPSIVVGISSVPVESDEVLPYTGAVWARSGETLFEANSTLVCGQGTKTSTRTYEGDQADAELVRLFESESIAALDSKMLMGHVYPPDSALKATLDIDKVDAARLFDVALAAYLLESARVDFSLDTLVNDYLGREHVKGDTECPQAVRDAQAVAQLAVVLEQSLAEDESLELYRTIDGPLIPVLAKMERTGIALNTTFLGDLARDGRIQIEQLRLEIYALAGREFSVDSPKQLGEVLFGDLKLPVIKKKKSGPSTDASVLTELVALHPIAEKLLQYRELNKLQSTYLEALPRLLGEDGRLHTSFNQTVAATGRLSSSNPNLQNIPVRTELGKRVREAFVPSYPDWTMLSVDYSQIELRVLAHLSGDQGLIDAFTSGADFHAATASRIFDVEPSEVDGAMRSRAKAVNFGIVYGQGARALGLSLDMPIKEAQAMIDRYYAAYPQVDSYLKSTIAFAEEHGWIATYFGRKRHIAELRSHAYQVREFGKRTAMNHPMQGTAADLIKLAMIVVQKRLLSEGFQARMLLQVHDELVFECPVSEVERLSSMVSDAMADVAKVAGPLEVTVSVGATWAEAK